MTFQEKREKMVHVLESVYLSLFAVILLYKFLGITSFPIPWKVLTTNADGETMLWVKILLEPPYYLLQLIVLLRFLVQEKYEIKKMLTAILLFIIGYYLWIESGHKRLLLFWLLMLGAWRIPFQRIIKVFVRLLAPAMLLTFLCSVTGIIEDYTYIRYMEDGEVLRHSFGIVAPTNFAAMVFFLVLGWWYLRREKISWTEIAGLFGLAFFLQWGSHARCSMTLTAAVGVLAAVGKLLKGKKLPAWMAGILTIAPTLAAAGMLVLSITYQATPFQVKLDRVLSTRLTLGKKAFTVFSLTPFGQYIRLFSNAENRGDQYYFYIDCSYLQLAIMYGLVILGVVLVAFLLIGCKAKAQQDWILLWILGLIAVHSIIEQHLVELPYCPFIIALLADLKGQSGCSIKEIFGKTWIKS